MENSTHPAGAASVPTVRTAAGAVPHDRDGHSVVAHYGSVPGELAVCLTTVGLADHSDYGVLELRGDSKRLDRVLVARFGEPPLASGSGRRLRGVWHLRLGPRRVLLVGPHAASAASASEPVYGEVSRRDIGQSRATVGIVGPRAARLLIAAGLPGEMAVGAVSAGAGESGVQAILRESRRRYLALVDLAVAETFWARLRAAGEPLGAALVGYDALALLNASSAAAD